MRRLWNGVLLGLAMAGAIPALAAEVEDNCAMCHDTAPLPAQHMAVQVMSLDACTMCHEPQAGDPFFKTVHTKHLEMGFDCSDCHGDQVPSADRLRQLTE